MDTDSFIILIKTEDFYKDIANGVEKKYDTSNYKVNRPLATGKNEKIMGLMKDVSGGKIMIEFVALRPKTYFYLMDDGNSDEKAEGAKKCVTKRRIKFNEYKICLFKNEIIFKLQHRFKREAHNVYTEEINNITRRSNDGKRLETFDNLHHTIMVQVLEKYVQQSYEVNVNV